MTPADERELRRLIRIDARLRLTHCFGKRKYTSKAAAVRNTLYERHHTTEAYRCRCCGRWHRGSSIRPRVVRQR